PITQTLEDVSGHRLPRYTIKADPDPSDETLQALFGHFGPIDGSAMVSQFREFDPRVAALAREVLAAHRIQPHPPVAEDDRWAWHAAAAEALTGHLRDNEDFNYTVDLSGIDLLPQTEPGVGLKDPIVQFLFDTRRGHCEYFASALAAMCNCAGIPARLVTGYAASEFDEDAGEYVIRDSNAHAWVEVQVSPWRWQAFDPTPPDELAPTDDGARQSLADRWRWLFDTFEARWADGFVAFDEQTRGQLLQGLDRGWSEKLGNALQATRQWLAAVNRAFYFGPAGYIWMGIVALAVVIAAVAIGTRMRRAARLRTTMRLTHAHGSVYHRMLWQLGFYLDMLEALEHCGRAKPAWQPPLQYAQGLSVRHPQGASLVRRLTELYYAARYGGRELSRDEVSRARELVEQLSQALRQPT
ncbi:MAG: DUF4129 domain-containing transglutaminase family protein, partial [Planctomycetota bacterium]